VPGFIGFRAFIARTLLGLEVISELWMVVVIVVVVGSTLYDWGLL